MSLAEYEHQALKTDRFRKSADSIKLAKLALGLFGETGSLLSEVKKKQRDSASYLNYHSTVVEEFGDVLWYLAIIVRSVGLTLAKISPRSDRAPSTFLDLQPQPTLPLDAPTTQFERTLLSLASAVGNLVGQISTSEPPTALTDNLASVLERLIVAANEAGVDLEEAARRNIGKTADRWPSRREFPALFDSELPEEEQLPRRLVIEVFERHVAGKTYVVQKCNGLFIGDRLTDNKENVDDYRFHDVFHYSFAAILGWSPVTRALFRRKRKSVPKKDEGQDGARAVIVEEGISTFVFTRAGHLDFFKNQRRGDLGFDFLKMIRGLSNGYEPAALPLWQWEEAILAGYDAFRFLREHRRGRLTINLEKRKLAIGVLK